MKLSVLALLVLVLAGCDPGAGSDAGLDAGIPDGGADAPPTPIDAPSCDPGMAPAGLPAVVGAIEVLASDAGSPAPPLLGGDPVGVWRFETVTIYAPAAVEGMIDTEASSVEGTAWLVVEETMVRMQLDLDVTLVTTVAGTIRRRQETLLVGSYTVAGTTLEVEPTCIEPAPIEPGEGFAPGFSVEGEVGTLVLIQPGMMGDNVIVLTGSRTAT